MPNLSQNLSFILLGEDRTASKTMTGAAATAEKVTARIGASFQKVGGIIGGEFGNVISGVGAGIDELGQKTKHLSTILTVGGGVALTAGIGLQQFGSAATQATDQLNAAITATGAASTDYTERIDKAVKKNENLNHSAVDTKQALQVLTQSTGDTGKALSLMGTVTDLAAAKHISLSDAALLVSRVLGGSGARTLVQFGIHMDGVGTKTEQGKRALAELAAKLDGQAKASVNNFGSQVDIVKTKVKDFAEEVAGPVGGALTALGGVATATGLILDIYKAKQAAAAAATLAAAAAADAAVVSEGDLTVATVALDGAMDANPIGLVAGALGVLAAVVVGGSLLQGTKDLTKAENEYATALATSNGLIDQNIQAVTEKALLDDGSLKAAQKLGISTADVVRAADGNKQAQAAVAAQTQVVIDKYHLLNQTQADALYNGGALSKANYDLASAAFLVQSSVGGQNQALNNSISTYKLSQQTLNDLSGTIAHTKDQYDALTRSIKGVPSLHVSSSGQVTYSDAKQRATGGIVQPGELTMVGERGPELVRMPAGSQVYPTGTGPAASSGGGSLSINISLAGANVYGSPNAYAKAIATEVRTAVLQGHLAVDWATGVG